MKFYSFFSLFNFIMSMARDLNLMSMSLQKIKKEEIFLINLRGTKSLMQFGLMLKSEHIKKFFLLHISFFLLHSISFITFKVNLWRKFLNQEFFLRSEWEREGDRRWKKAKNVYWQVCQFYSFSFAPRSTLFLFSYFLVKSL